MSKAHLEETKVKEKWASVSPSAPPPTVPTQGHEGFRHQAQEPSLWGRLNLRPSYAKHPGECILLPPPPDHPNRGCVLKHPLVKLPLGGEMFHTGEQLRLVWKHMSSHSMLRSMEGIGGGGRKLNDSLVLSDKGRRPSLEGTHGYTTGMLTWVFGWSAPSCVSRARRGLRGLRGRLPTL